MEKKNWRVAVVILRLVTLALLAAALIIIATNSIRITGDDEKITFKDAYALRYVLAVEVIGIAYMLLQIPLAVLTVSKGTFGGKSSIWFLQFADTLFALLFATGVGATFGLTVDLKKKLDDAGLAAVVPGLDNFFALIYVSAVFLLLATISTAAAVLTMAYYVAFK